MGAHDGDQLQEEHTKNPSRRRRCWPCELCQQQASVFCPWDEARLCDLCDANVHGANFLVARHSRHLLCPCCGDPALHSALTGPRIEPSRRQEACVQCTLQENACQREQQLGVEALSTAESCCIDANDDYTSSASTTSPAERVEQKRRPSRPLPRPRSHEVSSSSSAALSQEEGLGDSEDCSCGLPFSQSSTQRKRRRLPRRDFHFPTQFKCSLLTAKVAVWYVKKQRRNVMMDAALFLSQPKASGEILT
ncbi:hypothetical protein GOP47_0013871 [Adiantum capillus-veneris]|uniref:B box-type domain-containing protein n=1 Tax=Adiantum capillus-veneris TaxID=13818 RepID=A0A9D4ZFT2_ADICA|nr:hypothetical protein GOP47_0013871 [Adiantum capillus-veneris]